MARSNLKHLHSTLYTPLGPVASEDSGNLDIAVLFKPRPAARQQLFEGALEAAAQEALSSGHASVPVPEELDIDESLLSGSMNGMASQLAESRPSWPSVPKYDYFKSC